MDHWAKGWPTKVRGYRIVTQDTFTDTADNFDGVAQQSLVHAWVSPISTMTAVASLLKYRICAATSANFHSTTMVDRGERTNPA